MDRDLLGAQLSAVLALARSLARTGTTIEAVDGLVTAVPLAVDCDHVVVWLWDDAAGGLRCAQSAGYDAERAAMLEQTVVRPSDSSTLTRLLDGLTPSFVGTGADDAYACGLLERDGDVASALAPIRCRDQLLGVLAVSVRERPERLREAPGLTERLDGIASLAGPAIENGRLVDELAHKASHDALTGLPNRVGFGQLFDAVLVEARRAVRQVGLLFLDLDGFKEVNDLYGHDAGDELLRLVSERLDEVVRGGDTVARLGGDEFAVILSNVRSHDEVHAVSERIRAAFVEPFFLAPDRAGILIGLSVGEAVWPDAAQTVDALLRHADQSMYRDKVRGQRQPVR